MFFFKNTLRHYYPVYASSNFLCMKKLESLLQIEQCHSCFIDVKGFPVYIMKCPGSVSESIKRWISEEGFVCR